VVAIDRALPRFDISERHSIVVRAEPAQAYAALRSFDLADSWLSKLLFAIRRGRPPRRAHLRLDDILRASFVLLVEDPGREIVLGTVGRFWRLTGTATRIDASDFDSYAVPGTAKAVMNFRVEPLPDGRSRVITETRVLCADDGARRSFRRYWMIVAPGSALIRLEMLRLIRRVAERAIAEVP